jgi:hypothetical protein
MFVSVVIGTNIWPVTADPDPIAQAVRDAKPGRVVFIEYPKPARGRHGTQP